MIALVIALFLPVLALKTLDLCARRALPLAVAIGSMWLTTDGLGLVESAVLAAAICMIMAAVLDRGARSRIAPVVAILESLAACVLAAIAAYAMLHSAGVRGIEMLMLASLASTIALLVVLRFRMSA